MKLQGRTGDPAKTSAVEANRLLQEDRRQKALEQKRLAEEAKGEYKAQKAEQKAQYNENEKKKMLDRQE